MRISHLSADVCSSDLRVLPPPSPSVRFSILADHQRRARGPLFARALAAASWHRAARRDSFVVIPLSLPVAAEMAAPYVTRLRSHGAIDDPHDAALIDHDAAGVTFAGTRGLIALDGMTPSELDGDVLLIDPLRGQIGRAHV